MSKTRSLVSKVSINKYDPFQLKGALDDEIAYLLEEEKGFTEDNRTTDLKILVAFVACVLGVVSHFYPIPFPQNKPLLIGCVVGYGICASLYYLIEKRVQGNAFYESSGHGVNALKDFPKIRFESDLDAAVYKLKLTAKSETKAQKIQFARDIDLTKLVDECGYLHEYRVKEVLEETLQKFINAPRT